MWENLFKIEFKKIKFIPTKLNKNYTKILAPDERR